MHPAGASQASIRENARKPAPFHEKAAGLWTITTQTSRTVKPLPTHAPRALEALDEGDTLVITTLDRLGRSRVNMLGLSAQLRGRGINLRVLNLGGGNVDTGTPMGSMVFTVMAALAQMELEIKRERINDSVTKRRAAGRDLGGRRQQFSDSQIENARRLIDAGEPATHVARDLGMSRATLYRRMAELDARQWITSRTP